MFGKRQLNDLIGMKVLRIFMNEEYLAFDTDQGRHVFGVSEDGDSHSYFHDFHGVRKLLDNGPIIEVRELPVTSFSNILDDDGDVDGDLEDESSELDLDSDEDDEDDDLDYHDDEEEVVTECYGYQLITEHPRWGQQTSVFSFRNDSNGYYGGALTVEDSDTEIDAKYELFDDLLEPSIPAEQKGDREQQSE